MVEVVGRDERQLKEASCRNCAARLRYTRSDVFTHHYSACGSKESDPAIRCPSCSNIILVAA